jgi:uncharacterized protein YkwD/stress response protein SCP2
MAELVAGANMPLPEGAVRVRVAGPFDLSALVVGSDGKVSGDADFVFYNQPSTPGVRLAGDGLTVEATRLRRGATRVVLVASPADLGTPFGRLPPPAATVFGRDGREVARLGTPRLGSETVLQLAEIYLRDGRWKLRALGQGYADGLAGLARDFGVDVEEEQPVRPARARPRPSRPEPSGRPSAGDARPGAPGRLAAPGLLEEVVAGTNARRAQAGLVTLTVDARLAAAAQAHSRDMVARDFFAHENPDGASVADRVRAAGYAYAVVAENIAAGQRTAGEVVEGWMNSPGHRANILNPALRQIGIGYATGSGYGTYWTQVFGTPW